MTFEEELLRAFEKVTGRLRDEIASQMRGVADELSASARADRERAALDARAAAERDAEERLVAAVKAAEAKARDSAREEGRESARLDGQREAQQAGEEQTKAACAELRSGELAASGRLVDAVRAIERARSLTETLDTLVSCAGREASRVAVLLVVRGGRFRGWRFIGFGPSFDEATRIEFAADEAGVIHEAARTAAPVSGNGSGHVGPSFAELPAGGESFAVPISLGGQVVAVLYGDHGPGPLHPTNPESRIPHREPPIAWPDRLEVLARHAARCLEAQTALKAARALTERSEFPNLPPAHDDSPGDDEAAAQRYARLLVSEIKLYHEAEVLAGRRDRDLATRLGGEIARARMLYEQRVAPHVRHLADHFHVELVQTLADGDETLLEMRT